jgi:hypothetical protein
MEYDIKQIAPDVWRVDVAGAVRIIRYRLDSRTFAPWDICTADGRRLWASDSLESAFRWIEARTGHPAEALLIWDDRSSTGCGSGFMVVERGQAQAGSGRGSDVRRLITLIFVDRV